MRSTATERRAGSLHRRALLSAGGGLVLSLAVAPLARAGQGTGKAAADGAIYASACRFPDGRFGVALLDETGSLIRTSEIPARGHCAAVDPTGRRLVLFARRPGTFAIVLDRAGAAPDRVIEAAEGRHFEGHGQFCRDGRLLYAAENAYDDGIGVIGVYDVEKGFARTGELPCHGVGTHEILFAPDGRTLVVANGGILTHPDYPRAPLNLADMQPSLAHVDSETGDLVESVAPPAALQSLSPRHLAIDARGRAWLGCQWEGADEAAAPLLAVHAPGEGLRFVALPDEARQALRHYVGSLAIADDGRRLAVSGPRGGIVLVVDTETEAVVDRRPLHDGCGAAPATGGGFVLTSGDGDVVVRRAEADAGVGHAEVAWDNHLRRL
jgi:hypothetical protein